ncbi:MAG: GGDEF domain-containing protein [Gammaproteobacteria bacterium]
MHDHQMQTDYCETYGFDATWRQGRLALLGLTAADAALGEQLRGAVVKPHLDAIVAAFYARLSADAESNRILDQADRAALADSQSQYLLHFGEGFLEQGYFEDRLRIGLVHAWVGVPLSLYLCAYQVMQSVVQEYIERAVADAAERRALCGFLYKIAALDTSLASEVYHIAQMRHLESSVTRLHDERVRLRHAAGTDALTGLANRASLLPQLAQALSEALRKARPLCVIMSDLDRFKPVNDTYGHQAGDLVLRDTAVRLRTALRDFDLVGRYGGEEFIAVLLDTRLETALQVAERVRRRVGGFPYAIDATDLHVTLSQGIAQARPGDNVDTLIQRADTALYAAKAAGRDCVRVAEGDQTQGGSTPPQRPAGLPGTG